MRRWQKAALALGCAAALMMGTAAAAGTVATRQRRALELLRLELEEEGTL